MASLDDYRRMLDAYYKAHPYIGDMPAQTPYATKDDGYVSTPENDAYMKWDSNTRSDFMNSLTPEQRAERNQLYAQRDAKAHRNMQLAAMASFAGIGGLGALGAGGLGGAGAAEGLGGAYGAGSGWGADTLSAMGLGGAGEGAAGVGAGGIGGGLGSGSELFGQVGGWGNGLGAAGGSLGTASSGGNLLEQILAGVKGLGGAVGGGGINWTNLLGNLAGGLIQSHASGKATDALINAGNQSNALLEKMWQQGRADQAPYREAGTSALAGIQALLKDPSSIARMPDYRFGLDQGNKALANSAAARGMTYSGQQGKALQRYGQDYAGTKLNESYNRLASIAGIGQQATNQTGNLGAAYGGQMANTIQGIGNAQGSGYAAGGNAWNKAIGGVLNGMSEQDLIDAIRKAGGG